MIVLYTEIIIIATFGNCEPFHRGA